MNIARKRLGTMIKQLRERKGLTQDEVAQRAKVTKPYLSMLESGERTKPSLSVLKRIARVLGAPVTDLMLPTGDHEEFWQAEADLDFGPTSLTARRFSTREEAEEEARAREYRVVAWYRGSAGDKIRRALPVRQK